MFRYLYPTALVLVPLPGLVGLPPREMLPSGMTPSTPYPTTTGTREAA
jgi:hypothetical protein